MNSVMSRIIGLARRVVRGIRRRMTHAQAPARIAQDGQSEASAVPAVDQAMVARYTRREGFIITDIVSSHLGAEERFIILDGGAREALSDPRWGSLDPKRVRLYGFEPDDVEVAVLNRTAAERGLDYRYYAAGLWSETASLTFYENKSPGGGAFYPQNTALTDRWKFANAEQKFLSRDIFYPVKTSTWSLTSIDRWSSEHGISDIDFMKLNVQGAELEILKGCGPVLDSVIGLMVEVSFVESYRNRPFFADIDAFLRARHFSFFDLIGHHYMGRARSPITARHAPGLYPLWGQLIEGHGIYFRDPMELEARGLPVDHYSVAKLLKLASFAEMFGQNEYAFELLEWIVARQARLGDRQGEALAREVLTAAESRYRHILGGWAPLVPVQGPPADRLVETSGQDPA
jgi:FkbM family methyltransferase